jgi:predicted O-methyltransferase YrrM
VEVEVGEFLHGLVRLVKPRLCLETGTYVGDSAEQIGKALLKNGFGRLLTCDVDPETVKAASIRLQGLPVTVMESQGKVLIQSVSLTDIDFVFIDSGIQPVRLEELELLGNHNVAPLGIVAMHDVGFDCAELYDYFQQLHWPHLVFPSIVGLAIFQRPA